MRALGLFLSLLCLLLSSVLFSVDLCAKDAGLYLSIQERIGLVDADGGFGRDFVQELNGEITAYLSGKRDDIAGLSGRALMHMGDVRALLNRVVPAAVGIALCGMTLLFLSKRLRLRSALYVFGAFVLLGAVSAPVLAGLNFHELFVRFHELAFTNDLWLLDPVEDVLIRILPEAFFSEIAMEIMKKATEFWLFASGVCLGLIACLNGRKRI